MNRAWLFDALKERYEHAAEVEAYTEQVREGLRPEEEILLEQLLPHPSRIADVGCGAGREAFALQQKGHDLVALDISQSMLKAARVLARQRQVNIPFVWMPNSLRLPLSSASFDCVIALAQLFSHIPGTQARVALLKEMRRVVVTEGLLVMTVTDRQAAQDLYGGVEGSSDSLLGREIGREEGDLWVWQPSAAKLDSPLFFHLHTRQEVENELENAGWHLLQYIGGHELTPQASVDAHRYWFAVARPIQ